MNASHDRPAANRFIVLSSLTFQLLLASGAVFAAEESGGNERAVPTAAELSAFKSVDAQSNIEMRLATSAGPVVTKTKKTSKSVLKRIITPIMKPIEATWADLPHPREIVKFAQRLLHVDSPTASLADNFSEHPLTSRILNVGVVSAPEFSMTSVLPTGASRLNGMSLSHYVETPAPNETFETSMSRHSATQLQVRIRHDWAVLYEFNRTSSAAFRDDVGVGLGLKHTF